MNQGSSFGRFPAVSADNGKESEKTTYAKGSDPANWLHIDPATGNISFITVPDRESEYVVNGTYTATILAINNDDVPSTTATGTIVLRVEDTNDNIPIIKNLQPCICDNTKSLSVTAFDPDQSPFGAPFKFTVLDGNWKIGKTEGNTAELQSLKELWPGTFKLPVKVEDNQGSGEVHNLDVKVVECTKKQPDCSLTKLGGGAVLGASAIGLMVLGSLLLLRKC
uniref:Cadherin domain-containing protein n=1 Tax=Callorhinchus milii TaxID=7868 RepID=A0A4W3GDC2_CALMI